MRTRINKLLATLCGAALLATGVGLSAPANASGPASVTITIQSSGVNDPDGHFFSYYYDSITKSWEEYNDAASNPSGVATLLVPQDEPIRFCYHTDGPDNYQSLCYGGDTVDQATSFTLSGPLNLGTVNLLPKTVLNLSGITIVGKPVVGQRLNVDLASLPGGLDDVSIDWYRDASVSGGNVYGQWLADSPTYVVRASDVGHSISARIYANGPRYRDPSTLPGAQQHLTPALGPVVMPMGFSSAPMIKAPKWKKGKTVSYVAPAITPPGATTTYQWLRNGAPIKGATGSTYKLKRKDKKKKISVKVTYTYSGYETTTMESTPSPKIK